MSVASISRLINDAKVIGPAQTEPVGEIYELDLPALALAEPEPPTFLLPQLGALPFGEPTLLAAHGGGCKSTLAMQLVACMASGVSFMGEPPKRLHCSYLSFEDGEKALHWRLSRACLVAGVKMTDVASHLRIFDGTTWPGAWYSRREDGNYGISDELVAMRARIQSSDLIVVDGAADVFAGNENDRGMVKAFVRGLRSMIRHDGALLLLGHIDKQGSREGSAAEGYSGSTGWHNSVRSRLFMYRETKKDDDCRYETGNIVLEVKKSNYGRVGGQIVLRFDERSACLHRVDDLNAQSETSRRNAIRDEREAGVIVELIRKAYYAGKPIPASTNGSRTSHMVASSFDEFPDELRGQRGKARYYALLEKLRTNGIVIDEPRSKRNRHSVRVLNAPALAPPSKEGAKASTKEPHRARESTWRASDDT